MNDIVEEFGVGKLLELVSGKNGQPDYSKEEDFVSVSVNGKPYKVYRGWFKEGSGRGANSALSRMIFGTEEGLSGGQELTIQNDLAPYFNGVLVWLAFGALDESFSRRSIKLYELASYFGLEEMMKFIEAMKWPTKDRKEVVSVDNNVGCIFKFIRRREGFGFILDKKTRKEIWFSAGSVATAKEGEGGVPFQVGSECRFDIVIPRKGKRPNDPKAVNIRALGDEPFENIKSSFEYD